MNYRDFYKKNGSPWKDFYHLIPEGITTRQFEKGAEEEYKEHPQVGRGGAARIAVQHLAKNPKEYEKLQEKELIKGMNLEAGAGDEDFPRREDGALDAVHDGRPIHLSKIIQVGAEFGKGTATGELGGYKNIGVQGDSKGKDLSADQGGLKVAQDGDKEPITAGGKEVDGSLASKSVGGEVTGGQEQGGPNTKGSIAGTPKIDGGGEEAMTLSLQEAKSKLRGMIKEVLKEIRFDKETGKWVRLTEADVVNMKMGPSYKAPAGRQYKTSDDDQARKVEYEPEITEVHDEEEEDALYERYSELANSKRNLSESELDELRDLGMKLDKINEAQVDMKMGPSYKVVQPTLAKTSEPDQFSRTNQYDPEVSEVAPPGWEGTVKAMKKHKDIDNPWALAWHMKGQGAQPHKEEQQEGEVLEAGGGAVQHSSFRTAKDMPQTVKNRHRGDIDEAKKKA